MALPKKSPVVKKIMARVPANAGKGQEQGSGGQNKSARPGRPAPKNRLALPKSKAISIKKISASSAATNGGCGDEDASPVYDSVEWSFREKLKKAEKKHKVSESKFHMRMKIVSDFTSIFPERARGASSIRDAGGGGR